MSIAQHPQRRSRRDWSSGLPQEHLECISKRLSSGHDAASFRSVCSRWHAALPFANFAPLLMLPFDPESDSVTFYSLKDEKVFSLVLPDVQGKVPCGSSHGWLALMDEAASVVLLNPFTGVRVELPSANEHIAMSSARCVSMVGSRWVFRSEDYDGHAVTAIKLDKMRDVFFREIVLSSPLSNSSHDCVAMAVLANSTEVAFCRVGDRAWTLLDTNLECCVNSLVHCQQRFLAIGCLGEISICDTTGATLTVTLMPSLAPPAQLCHRNYLEVNGELHLVGVVVRAFHKARRFTYRSVLYKCDLLDGTPAWSRVKDIGNLTMFVSKHFKASFNGTSVSRFKRNCVYFSEPLYGNQEDLDHLLEIVDIATGTSELLPYHQNMQMQGSEAICWIRPNLWTEGGQSSAKMGEDHKRNSSKPRAERKKSQRLL